jgi:hypothetical protein
MAWAMVLKRAGAAERAAAELGEVDRLGLTLEAMPWAVIDMAIRGGVSLAIWDRNRARALAKTAREALVGWPDAGLLPERLRRLDEGRAAAKGLPLTSTELRLLPSIPTHLSLQEIRRRSRSCCSRSAADSHADSHGSHTRSHGRGAGGRWP